MTTTTKFSKRENIKMLWDILLGELGINNNANKSMVPNIQYIFEQNMSPFIQENNKGVKKKSLMELNKEFLGQVVFAVYKLFPNLKKGAKQITILEDVLESLDSHLEPYRVESQSDPYRAEDIQASRKTASEKEFEKKRSEFENYMFVKKPDEPIFSYGDKADERIKEMDVLVSEKMAERNLEPFITPNLLDAELWLKPIETKETKGVREIGTKEQDIPTPLKGGRLRHINIDDDNNITLNIKDLDRDIDRNKDRNKDRDKDRDPNGKKRVSWNEKLSSFASDTDSDENITDGKKIDNKYIAQLSQPLPEIMQQLPQPQQVANKINTPNPIIPMNELIKQNNEMNTKIENLYELIFKLTNMVQELTDKQQHSSNNFHD